MPQIKANGLTFEYEVTGRKGGEPVMLVMGYTAQMINWPPEFHLGLGERGFEVVRFDNRDVGLSEKLSGRGVPNLKQVMETVQAGKKPDVPYTLHDMADDALAILRALNMPRAHIVGASMGGMIVQIMAAKAPDLVATMTSIMSTSGDPSVPPATPEAMKALQERADPPTRENVVRLGVKNARVTGSPAYPRTDEELAERIGRAFDRSYYPEGYARQYAAILATGSRVPLLKDIRVPTLVIHGRDDPLVRVEGGIDTARHIPGARLEIIDGMGHDIPPALVPRLLDLIEGHVRKG